MMFVGYIATTETVIPHCWTHTLISLLLKLLLTTLSKVFNILMSQEYFGAKLNIWLDLEIQILLQRALHTPFGLDQE